jgi:hypothetical protein
MTQSTQTITALRQRMIEDMRMRKFSPKTQTGYIRAVRQFAGFLGASPDTATTEDLVFQVLQDFLHLKYSSSKIVCRGMREQPEHVLSTASLTSLPCAEVWVR